MTNLAPISQNAHDLLLATLETERLPKMQVLVSEYLAIQGWRFEFAIIGESHYVRIEHEGRLLMLELLACLDIQAAYCKLYQPFAKMQPFAYQDGGYQVSVHFETHLPIWTQSANRLDYHFPITHGQVPETRIQWQVTQGRLTWQTLHSYPNETGMMVVLSESGFQFE